MNKNDIEEEIQGRVALAYDHCRVIEAIELLRKISPSPRRQASLIAATELAKEIERKQADCES